MNSRDPFKTHHRLKQFILQSFATLAIVNLLIIPFSHGAIPGLPFIEDFSDNLLEDSTRTNAVWSTAEQEVKLAWRESLGTYQNQSSFTGYDVTATGYTRAAVMADFNYDGRIDVIKSYGVTISTSTQQIIANYHDNVGNPYDTVTVIDATYANKLQAADVNGDGYLDLIVVGPNRIYLNNQTATPFTASFISFSGSTSTNQVAFGDVDNDGDLDLFAANNSTFTDYLYLNNGSTTTPFSDPAIAVNTTTYDSNDAEMADMNGDGLLDLVIASDQSPIVVLLNNGSSSNPFTSTPLNVPNNYGNTRAIDVGDIDNDGDMDIVSANYAGDSYYYLNNGTNDPFSHVVNPPALRLNDNGSEWNVRLTDINNDGYLDAIYPRSRRVLLNTKTSTPFLDPTDGSYSQYVILIDLAATGIDNCAFGDADADGDIDIYLAASNNIDRIYINEGFATPFSGVNRSDITSARLISSTVKVVDFDGDTNLDVVVAYNGGGTPNQIYINNGTNTPFDGVTPLNITSDNHSTRDIAVGDLDNDGDLDTVSANFGSSSTPTTNTYYLYDSVSGTFTSAEYAFTSLNSIALGDMDNDGDLDIVAAQSTTGVARIYYNQFVESGNTAVSFVSTDISDETFYADTIEVADIDNDLYLDVIVGTSGQDYIYINQAGVPDYFAGSGLAIAITGSVNQRSPPSNTVMNTTFNITGANAVAANRPLLFSSAPANADTETSAR